MIDPSRIPPPYIDAAEKLQFQLTADELKIVLAQLIHAAKESPESFATMAIYKAMDDRRQKEFDEGGRWNSDE